MDVTIGTSLVVLGIDEAMAVADRLRRRTDVAPGPTKGNAGRIAHARHAGGAGGDHGVAAEAGPGSPISRHRPAGTSDVSELEKSFRGGECPGGSEEGPSAGCPGVARGHARCSI